MNSLHKKFIKILGLFFSRFFGFGTQISGHGTNDQSKYFCSKIDAKTSVLLVYFHIDAFFRCNFYLLWNLGFFCDYALEQDHHFVGISWKLRFDMLKLATFYSKKSWSNQNISSNIHIFYWRGYFTIIFVFKIVQLLRGIIFKIFKWKYKRLNFLLYF
jgi:hypothetical protein